MDPDWGSRYPHLTRTRAWLADLPSGSASYPECRSKASIWKNLVKWTDVGGLAGRVPPGLLPDESIVGGAWIPTVQNFTAHLVLRDCLFDNDEAMCEHFRVVDRRLLGGPLYRVMFALASPTMVVNASDRRFGALFQGITFEARPVGPSHVEIELRYPPRLLPRLVGRLYLIAFEVAVELAGGQHVAGRVLEHSEVRAHYDLRWK